MIKTFFRVLRELKEEESLRQKMKKDGREFRKVNLQINPCCNIEANYDNKNIMRLPLFYMIHSFLKDYNYDPESKQDKPIIISIKCSPDIEFDFPLYVSRKENLGFGVPLTTKEMIALGYIIPKLKGGKDGV